MSFYFGSATCCIRFSLNNSTANLRPVSVEAHVNVLDAVASVQLNQCFQNNSSVTVSECEYVFPVPAGAAIHAFEFERGDKTRVVGVVKATEEAKQDYEEAKAAGKTAAFGTESTKDLFNIQVGNVQSKERIVVRLTYAVELKDGDASDELRFALPCSTFPRYGKPSVETASALPQSLPIDIKVQIQQAGKIKRISCPSAHPIQLELGRGDSHFAATDVPDFNLALVNLTQQGDMTKDFILTIVAVGSDQPRCFAEIKGSAEAPESVAMHLSLVAKYSIPDPPHGAEYIFLVDRSGSMGGEPMQMAKKALTIITRALPTKNTSFNIVSFGSRHEALWPRSAAYTQDSLNQATQDIAAMDSNFGGTEIRSALAFCFSTRDPTKATNILCWTDGGAYDVQGVYAEVNKAVKDAARDAPLRVFSLGIGSGVSTEMVEGMARHGKGISAFVAESESMTGITAKLVKAARTQSLDNINIKWIDESKSVSTEDDFEMVDKEAEGSAPATTSASKASEKFSFVTSTSDFGLDKDVGPPKPTIVDAKDLPKEAVQQAPIKHGNVYPVIRSNVYALIDGKAFQQGRKQSIRLSGVVPSTQAVFELDIPVTFVQSKQNPIHVLAARKLVQSLEDGKHNFSSSISKDSALLNGYLKAKIIDVSTTYQITSRHTSFIAIDQRDQKAVGVEGARVEPPMARMRHRAPLGGGSPSLGGARYGAAPPPGSSYVGADVGSPKKKRMVAAMSSPAPMFGMPPPPPSSAQPPHATMSTFGSAVSFGSAAAKTSSFHKSTFGCADAGEGDSEMAQARPAPVSEEDKLTALAILQAFDGHFDFSADLLTLLGLSTEEARQKLPGESEVVVATVLALHFMDKALSNTRVSWEALWEKAEDFLKGEGAWESELVASLLS